MIDDETQEAGEEQGNQADAAQQHSGQDQEPKQAQEESSSVWDSQDHSDAPGPFGTGDQWSSADEDSDDRDSDDGEKEE